MLLFLVILTYLTLVDAKSRTNDILVLCENFSCQFLLPSMLFIKNGLPHVSIFPGEGNGNPLQYSCLENPMDGGTWYAAVHGVAQSRTRLKWFSSSSSSIFPTSQFSPFLLFSETQGIIWSRTTSPNDCIYKDFWSCTETSVIVRPTWFFSLMNWIPKVPY